MMCMSKRNRIMYAAPDVDADILYTTHFSAPDPFLFVQTTTGRRWILIGDLEIDRARKESTAHRVFALSEYAKLAKEKTGRTARVDVIATFLKSQRIHSAVVPESFPAGMLEALRRRGIRVTVKRGAFIPQRVRKSPAEIREIRKTMRITEKGLAAGIDMLKKSTIRGASLYYKGKRLTSEMLRAEINTTILADGCMPQYTIVAGGKQGCDPHDKGSGPLRAHQPIIIDVFPRSESSGYFGDITRTVVRGKASDRVKTMYAAVKKGQAIALSMIRHGAMGMPIHNAIHAEFERRGFATGRIDGRMQGFFHGTGHGVGLQIHEAPSIGYVNDRLTAGMVVTVEPGLYYYPAGGVRIEDTVAVTRTGIKNLTRFPKFLEI